MYIDVEARRRVVLLEGAIDHATDLLAALTRTPRESVKRDLLRGTEQVMGYSWDPLEPDENLTASEKATRKDADDASLEELEAASEILSRLTGGE